MTSLLRLGVILGFFAVVFYLIARPLHSKAEWKEKGKSDYKAVNLGFLMYVGIAFLVFIVFYQFQ